MAYDIEKLAKETELHGQIQMIQGLCKALYRATDEKQEVNEGVIKVMHDICNQMLGMIDKYYTIETELRNMK